MHIGGGGLKNCVVERGGVLVADNDVTVKDVKFNDVTSKHTGPSFRYMIPGLVYDREEVQ